MITVSFIIPVYNVERYLTECMESVLAQTERDYEVILIDDGSTDNSGDMCDRYTARFPDKIQVIHQKNQGQSAARNAGIAAARGEFLFFLDSDDKLASSDVLSELLRLSNGCDLVSFAWKEVPDGEEAAKIELPKALKNYRRTYENGRAYLTDVLKYGSVYLWYPWRYLYRTTFWRDNKFSFRVGIKYEDIDLIYRVVLAADGIAVAVDKASYLYRTNRVGSTVNTVSAETYLHMLSAAARNIREVEAMDDLTPELKRLLTHDFSCVFYMALIFSTVLNNQTEKQLLWNRLREEVWMCDYTNKGKQLFVKYLVKSLGLRTTARLLGIRKKLQECVRRHKKKR